MVIEEDMLTQEVKLFEKPIAVAKSFGWIENEVVAILIKTQKADFDLCGKSMLDWVKMACLQMETKVIQEPREEDFVAEIINLSHNKKIALVLYSDTPLLQQKTLLDALDYFSTNNMNALSLSRGYIFKVDYLQQTEQVFSPALKNFAPDEFKIIDNAQSISEACETIWQKIREFHKASGVILKGESSIYIDADVQIESGVIIEPNNVLKGNSVIEENVILKSGNYIENSIVAKDSILQGLTIVDGKIK